MTLEEEQLVMMLFLKHGGHEELLDIWLYNDTVLTMEEEDAFTAWINEGNEDTTFKASIKIIATTRRKRRLECQKKATT